MERKITLSTPKQISDHTQITGAMLDYCYFRPDGITAYMNGGAISEHLPLEGLSPEDRALAEDFAAMLCRLAGAELTTGEVKEAARAKREAEEASHQESGAERPTRTR